jgi:hypothetical protein
MTSIQKLSSKQKLTHAQKLTQEAKVKSGMLGIPGGVQRNSKETGIDRKTGRSETCCVLDVAHQSSARKEKT